MKKISKELLKTYYLILFLISFFSISSIFVFYLYIWNESKSHIKTIETFLDYEFYEFETKEELKKLSDDSLFKVLLEEAPKIPDTFLEVFYKDKKYAEAPFLPNKKLNSIDYTTKINFYNIKNLGQVEVHITKRFTKNRFLIQYTIGAFSIFSLTCLFLIIYIQKKFYNRFNNSLNNLMELTQKFSLDSDLSKRNKENNFIEFYILQQSFFKMIDRIQEQSKNQVNFINNASHELKTPIFILKGYLEMLFKWGKNDSSLLDESLNIMQKEVKNMQELVEKLLFLAKNNNFKLTMEDFDLNNILLEIISKLSFVYPKQKINYIQQKNILVNSDKLLLKLLFTNIIENALKYGNNKDITIEVNSKKDSRICIKIQDFGQGVSKDALPHIFEPFFREDEARNRELKSHGLGLSIVKEITSLLNLDLYFDSSLGEGTTVTIFL